jgi:Na+/alanine symporter
VRWVLASLSRTSFLWRPVRRIARIAKVTIEPCRVIVICVVVVWVIFIFFVEVRQRIADVFDLNFRGCAPEVE